MKKIFNFVALFALLAMPLSLLASPVLAQATEETTTYDTTVEEYDWESYYDDWNWDYEAGSSSEDLGILAGVTGLFFGGAMIVFSLAIGFAFYIYFALSLMTIARKLGEKNAWFAWIPILNMVLLFKLGNQNPWLLLLLLIPGIGALIVAILTIIALMSICERRGYDKLLGLLYLVPVANLVLFGILAWGKREA
ncbi:MAG: DUF5684 domain-containing protein [Candidatus Dojkabacteria bacterium]